MVAALAAGWLLAGATASPAAPIRTAPVTPASPVTGAVDAAGTPIGGAHGWTATRVQPGRYQLAFEADLVVEVMSWDVPAAVTVKPVAGGAWLVDFIEGGTPTDAAFSFVASLAPTSSE